jgi:hypothetical protein
MQSSTDPIISDPTETPVTAPRVSKNKTWRIYLFEFTLLFTAVVLGFLADHLREQYAEHRQGMEYLRSFYEDLQTDTTRIAEIIAHEEAKMQILNATAPCYDSVTAKSPSHGCVAVLVRNSIVSTPFVITERTLQQLMTGGFRLLEKQDTDSIMKYVSEYRYLQDHQNTVYQESQVEVRKSQNEVVDFPAFMNIATIQVTKNDADFRLPAGTTILRNVDHHALNRFFNELHKYRMVTLGHVNQLKRMKETQERLIRYFQERYGFQ